MKKNQHYYYVEGSDGDETNRINLTTMELKVIYNHFIDVLEDYPDMMTYQSVADKIKKKLDADCRGCDYFYGVNEITNMEWFLREDIDEVEVAVELNVQGTQNDYDEDMVVFFSQEQIDTMHKVNKRIGRNAKKNK